MTGGILLSLADALRTDQYCFRVVRLGDPSVVRLRELTRLDEELNFCFQRHCCQLRQHSIATIRSEERRVGKEC